MIIFVAIIFFVPSLVYDIIAGVFKSEKYVVNAIYQIFAFQAPFITSVFTAASSKTQLAYRLGDSCTNAITPIVAFIPFIVTQFQKYKKDAGIGTHFSMTMPYALGLLLSWITFFVVYVLLSLPIGPGVPIHWGV